MALTPTAEQQAIIEAFGTGDNLVIEAGAGSGKTSTLKMLGAADPGRAGVYIAYNRAIAEDAKGSFPRNVSCSTAHALAFRAVGKHYAGRLNGPRLPASLAAEYLGFKKPWTTSRGTIPETHLARLAIETVTRYCHSADREIASRHVPLIPTLELEEQRAIAPWIVPMAATVWADLQREAGRFKFEHDHYLKIWALGDPVLPCEYVLLDEAQDANPVIADIVARQDAQRILVGDSCQAIYGWRGAVDAMADFTGRRLKLSQSFRFGQAVADEANKWLEYLEAPLRLRGFERVESRVAELEEPRAVLCRTNAAAIHACITASAEGRAVALVGGGDAIRRLALAAKDLKAGRRTNHPELFLFTSWRELQEYVREDAAGQDLRVFVQLIDDLGVDAVLEAIDALVEERDADVVVSTAHKAKGREWDTVQIAGDFRQPKDGSGPGEAEAMLAYVAVTRAKLVLDRGGLDWIDGLLKTAAGAAS
jgi:superfamily I DNA/RNA helicase